MNYAFYETTLTVGTAVPSIRVITNQRHVLSLRTSLQGVDTGGTGGAVGGSGESEEARSALGLFEYIERLHQRAPLFYNLLYTPDLDNPVRTYINLVTNE